MFVWHCVWDILCVYIYIIVYIYICGWWFQTCFIFHNIWDNPSHWLIFFRGVETTNQIYIYIYTYICLFLHHVQSYPGWRCQPTYCMFGVPLELEMFGEFCWFPRNANSRTEKSWHHQFKCFCWIYPLENHRKTIGKWWFNEVLWWFNGI